MYVPIQVTLPMCLPKSTWRHTGVRQNSTHSTWLRMKVSSHFIW